MVSARRIEDDDTLAFREFSDEKMRLNQGNRDGDGGEAEPQERGSIFVHEDARGLEGSFGKAGSFAWDGGFAKGFRGGHGGHRSHDERRLDLRALPMILAACLSLAGSDEV